MNPLSATRRKFPQDAAGRFMYEGDTAFRRGRMQKAYDFYAAAAAVLDGALALAPDRADICYRLAEARISQCYPAYRKSLARSTPDKEGWAQLATKHEKQGCDRFMQAGNMPERMSDDDLFKAILCLHNCALRLSRTFKRSDADSANHYIDSAYALLEKQQPGEPMPGSTDLSFKLSRAFVAFTRKQYDEALTLLQPSIDAEEARIQRARRGHRQLPPPAWLRIPTELRDKVLAAKRGNPA